MANALFIQFTASAAAVGGLVALAAWARIARPAAPLDEARARLMIAQEFPGRRLDGVWVAVDGAGALARSGAAALVLCRSGDGYVGRAIPWAQAIAGSFRDGLVRIDLGDIAAPRAVLAFAHWPPPVDRAA